MASRAWSHSIGGTDSPFRMSRSYLVPNATGQRIVLTWPQIFLEGCHYVSDNDFWPVVAYLPDENERGQYRPQAPREDRHNVPEELLIENPWLIRFARHTRHDRMSSRASRPRHRPREHSDDEAEPNEVRIPFPMQMPTSAPLSLPQKSPSVSVQTPVCRPLQTANCPGIALKDRTSALILLPCQDEPIWLAEQLAFPTTPLA